MGQEQGSLSAPTGLVWWDRCGLPLTAWSESQLLRPGLQGTGHFMAQFEKNPQAVFLLSSHFSLCSKSDFTQNSPLRAMSLS